MLGSSCDGTLDMLWLTIIEYGFTLDVYTFFTSDPRQKRFTEEIEKSWPLTFIFLTRSYETSAHNFILWHL